MGVFPISRKFSGDFHNSRTSNDIDMKLGPVTKLDKKNTATSKISDDDVMSANCDVIIIFSIYGQFVATQKPDSGHMISICKTYIFINSSFSCHKNLSQTQLPYYCFE